MWFHWTPFVEHIINNTDWNIVVIDKLTYASMGFKRFNEGIFQNAIANKRLKKLLLGIYPFVNFQ